MIMIKEQRKSFYNLVFQKSVVNMYYPKTHFNQPEKNYGEWKKEKKIACDLT